MSVTIHLKSNANSDHLIGLVKSAIAGEISWLELALDTASKKLQPFEQEYRVSSDSFIENMAAEDLEGSDDEYVRWAGEYRLKQRLEGKLQQLRDIEYDQKRK